MKTLTSLLTRQALAARQRGVVLFFALIALLAMSLAAVALLRSVDTSTIIAGNLALKQGATVSADAGIENAINYMATLGAPSATYPVVDAAHPLNHDALAFGYYASMDPALDLTNPLLWHPGTSAAVNPDGANEPTPDSSGNKVRYIIQRMCRTSGVVIPDAKCLFGEASSGGNLSSVIPPQNWCPLSSPGCPQPGEAPLLRITARTEGPKGTISYVQVIAY